MAADDGDRTAGLVPLGLHVDEAVRWRRRDGGNWQTGTVIGCEADGSVAVRDRDGGWRSIVADRLEARRPDRRGRLRWQPVSDAAAAGAQLSLWEATTPSKPSRPRSPRTRNATLRPSLRAR
jgi:hypothetical protein